MERAFDLHALDLISVRSEERAQLRDGLGVRATREADEERAIQHEHVAAVERRGCCELEKWPVGAQRLGGRFTFAAPRERTGARHDRDFVEHDGDVFDEHRVRVLG